MLNISENRVPETFRISEFGSFRVLRKSRMRRVPLILFVALLVGLVISMFLPWTQNVNARGYVTTRQPEQRPQAIHSIIPGRLENWYVREGDFVEKGDTIAFISEVKSEYLDPELITRTSEQLQAKTQTIESYDQKIVALQNQYTALEEALKFKRAQNENKILQSRNKIAMDSIDLIAFQTNFEIAENQASRTRELYNKGLKTLTELQEKELKLQEAQAKVTVQQNKLLNQKNELANLYIEMSAIESDYADKLAKSQSEQQSALSDKFEGIGDAAKLQNQLSNYNVRQANYYITAPQSGFITKTIQTGLGETVKEGVDIATIMPSDYEVAVEIYLMPMDLPLISLGGEVRLRFDGWPAIVISGWPESSTGMFTGEVVAIDQFIDENGFYRVLISPRADTDKKWPDGLRVGTGARAFMLLKDVPVWYEIWRQLNGFPPDYYGAKNTPGEIKRKAPLKSVK